MKEDRKPVRRTANKSYVGEWPTPFQRLHEITDADERMSQAYDEIEFARSAASRCKQFYESHWDMTGTQLAELCRCDPPTLSRSFLKPPNDSWLKGADWAKTDDPFELRPLAPGEKARRIALQQDQVVLLCRRVLERTPQSFLFGAPHPIVLHRPFSALVGELVRLDVDEVETYRRKCGEVFDAADRRDEDKLEELRRQRANGPESLARIPSEDPMLHLHQRILEREIFNHYYSVEGLSSSGLVQKRMKEIEENDGMSIFNKNERRPINPVIYTIIKKFRYGDDASGGPYAGRLAGLMRVAVELGSPVDYFVCGNYAWGDNPLLYRDRTGRQCALAGEATPKTEKIRDILGMLLLLDTDSSGELIGDFLFQLRHCGR